MGKPKNYESTNMALRMDIDLKKKLERISKKERRSMTSMIEILIDQYPEKK